ncbi:MAG: DUF4349 domain-containing protein [Chloroflexota bacterium]
MHTRALLAVAAALTLILSSACAAAREPTSRPAVDEARPATGAAPAAAPPQAPRPAALAAPTAGVVESQAKLPSTDRMIIRTVSITIGVTNVAEAHRFVESVAADAQGIVASSQMRQDGDRAVATITIRVPSDSATFQGALARIRSVADRVIEEQAQGQDVTEEYVDLESRMRALNASRDALLALNARAQKVEDVIQINRELTNVNSQIEQVMGRKQSIERRVDMATITVQIRELASISRGGWNPGDIANDAARALVGAARGLATAGIWLAVWSPVWGAVVLVIWFLGRRARRLFRAPPRPNRPSGLTPDPAASQAA